MRLYALLAVCALPVLAAAVEPSSDGAPSTATPLKPFVATYDVKRGGKSIGEATMTLSRTDTTHWSLITETRGTAGMARLLGLDVREESRFTDAGAALQGDDYRYRQEATIKSKQRSIAFDWNANEARVTEKDEVFRYAIRPGTIDRHMVVVALGRTQHLPELSLTVASKDSAEAQRFVRRDSTTINLPAGQFAATRFERVDKPDKGSSWYTPHLLAPLKVEQLQKDGNAIVMELKAVR